MGSRRRLDLVIIGSQKGGVLRGRTRPGAEIEAVNWSASAADWSGVHETVTVAHADRAGRFKARMSLRDGDVLRVRARRDGNVTPWMLVRARCAGSTARPVRIALARIGLVNEGDVTRVVSVSRTRPIGPPGLGLIFRNERTGATLSTATDPHGMLRGRLLIAADPGDTLTVMTDAPRRRKLGTLAVPACTRSKKARGRSPLPCRRIARLGLHPDVRVIRAPLFTRRPRAEDVRQSELENCYVASAAAALAHVRPKAIEQAITPLGSGRYRVRLHRRRAGSDRISAYRVPVTSELYVRPSGDLLYGSVPERRGERAPLWWPLVEKAFAQSKGSYRALGDGGCADLVLSALCGRPARRFFVNGKRAGEADRVFDEIERTLRARLPVCAGTWGPSPRAKAVNAYVVSGLVPDHAYSVLACRRLKSGRRVIGVRNPWAEDAKAPCRVRKNGYLELDVEEFVKLFCVVLTVR